MNFSEYQNTIKKLSSEINIIEQNTIHSLSSRERLFENDDRMSQEQFDYSSIYEGLKEILMPSIDYYTYLHDDSKKLLAQKVFFVAICEMIKQDYNRGMLITFRNVTGETEINTNRYYDLLQRVSDSQELLIEKSNGRRLFEKTYILETGIPKNLTKYVIRMFKIYWRYFREIEAQERRLEIHNYLFGDELSQVYIVDPQDARIFEDYRNYLKDFPEKAIRVFDKLDDIFTALDECDELINDNEYEDLIETINSKVGFDISTVLRDSELISIYYSYLQQIPINKLLKILNNLPKNERIIMPDGSNRIIEGINEKNICCGVYQVRGNRYDVVIDPVISLDDIIGMNCNRIISLAKDYYCYVSRNEFEIDYDGREVQARRLIYKGQERLIWFGKLAPASIAYVDGKKVVSSEIYKRSIVVNKYFDYDKRESRLQIKINSIKVNYPENKYKKLTISVNGKEDQLLAVGDSQGKFYREGIQIELDENRKYDIKYRVNNEDIFNDVIELKKNYLFDKWNGTEYFSDKKNNTHSGSFVYFSSSRLDENSCQFQIETSYYACGYFIYEFSTKTTTKIVEVDDAIYSFERAGKPSLYICAEEGVQQFYDDLSLIRFRVVNLDENGQYAVYIENSNGTTRYACSEKEYILSDLVLKQKECVSGKWNISIWEKQKKLDEVGFTLIPKIYLEQKKVTLDGKDVYLNISSDEECFMSSLGGYTSTIEVNIGQAELIVENDEIRSTDIEYYVYLDKYEICKAITFVPSVWSFRAKEKESIFWERKQQISVNTSKPNETKVAVLSNANMMVYVNGNEKWIQPGINEISIVNTIGILRKRNEIVVTDGSNSWKQLVTCNTFYEFKGISVEKDTVITIQYNGPVSENLIIRYFINGILEKNIYKESFKNNFLIHILLGETSNIVGKRISVDIKNESVNVPTGIFDEVIVFEKKTSELEKKEINKKNKKNKLESISKYVDVNSLKTIYYNNNSEPKMEISIKKIQEKIGEWLNEDENK